jgi:hypothetical protein
LSTTLDRRQTSIAAGKGGGQEGADFTTNNKQLTEIF